MSIRVLLADDHNILRMALRVLLMRGPDIDVVAGPTGARTSRQ